MFKCDPLSGTCVLPETQTESVPAMLQEQSEVKVRYIGDPMCSWCWGIAPTLKQLAAYCAQNRLDFTVTVGGLRAGGGDEWNTTFKTFLRHEWEQIQRTTGQPFGFSLLERSDFNYDTEPACRAVVTASNLLLNQPDRYNTVLTFFSDIQQKFYVDGFDPKEVEFYADLCQKVGIRYEDFRAEFLSSQAIQATLQQFALIRRWGVRGFPSILLEQNGETSLLASGYISYDALITRLEEELQGPVNERPSR